MPQLKISRHFDNRADVVFFNGSCLEMLPEVANDSVQLVGHISALQHREII